MTKTWQCGDCGRDIPKTEDHCGRYLDDYLALRGGSVESAITRAVEEAIAPLVNRALAKLESPRRTTNQYTMDWSAA